MTESLNIQPFVKWAGGKRQLLTEIRMRIPKKYDSYFEPFVGGGAVLFDLQPEKSIINDKNKILIHTYKTIRDNSSDIIKILTEWDKKTCSKEEYYEIRNLFNNKIENNEFDIEMACLFIYINKRCFNGLYRVNSKGLFNVPFNGKELTSSFSKDNIENISKFLQNVEILNEDFEKSLEKVKKGDFVFFDSPYAPLNPTSFESYTKEGFDLESHKRLAELYKELDNKGCFLMLTNHNTELINDLYKDYNIDVVNVKRLINRNADGRVGKEVIITNYEY